MNFSPHPMLRESRGNPILILVTLIVFAVAAYSFSQYVINDDIPSLAYIALISLGGAFVVAMLNDWKRGVYFFFTWLVFEDLARKFLGNNMAIYFAKDFLLAVVYLSFFIAYRRKSVQTIRPPFAIPLLCFVWFGILQVFNPASTALVYGILGVKLFYLYVPLFFVGYALVNSEVELRRFFKVNAVLILIITSVGVTQSIVGPSFLNPARPADEIRELSQLYRTSPITGLVSYRAPSVFVSAGRYTNFLLIAWSLMLAYTGYLLLRHRRGRNLAFVAVACIYAAILLSGSRGMFMWSAGVAIASVFGFIWGAPWRQKEFLRVFRTVQRAALGIALAIVALFFVFPEALMARLAIYSETLTPGSSASELQFRTWDYPLRNFLGAFNYERWPYGYGIGTSSLGVQYVAKILHEKPMGVGVESGFGALVVEMGVGGLALWLIMSISILVSGWKVVKKLKGSPWFPVAFVIFFYSFVLLLPMTFTSMVAYEDFIINAYFWLSLGILFRLPSLALSAQFANVVGAQKVRFRTR
ncbi:MAG: hypothetical protein M3P45_09540 [Acidobacteriota bacterium]|nr:hypothetical protein [Acidobacteriota bacterium]